MKRFKDFCCISGLFWLLLIIGLAMVKGLELYLSYFIGGT